MATYNFTQTGAEIQAILDRVEANTGATYMGVATPSTDTSGITTQKVFYLAGQAGTYTNMGGSTHSSGIGIFVYNGSAWSYQNVPITGNDVKMLDTSLSTSLEKTIQMQRYMGLAKYMVFPYACSTQGVWGSSGNTHIIIPVYPSQVVTITKNASYNFQYSVFKSYTRPTSTGGSPDFATGYTKAISSQGVTITIPEDGYFLYLLNTAGANSYFPSSIVIDGYDISKDIRTYVDEADVRIMDTLTATINGKFPSITSVAQDFPTLPYPLERVNDRIIAPTLWSTLSANTEYNYYVSESGADTNNGLTPQTAYRTIKKAFTTISGKTTTCHLHILGESPIFYADQLLGQMNVKCKLLVTCDEGRAKFITGTNDTFSLVSGYTNVYKTTTGSSTQMVGAVLIANSNKDSFGLYKPLTAVSSIASVESTADSYYIANESGTYHLYCHLSDSTNINLVKPILTGFQTRFQFLTASNDSLVYLSNIDLISGFYINRTAGNYKASFIAENCTFQHSFASDVCPDNNTDVSMFIDCVGGYAKADIFNSHTSTAMTDAQRLEKLYINLNCIAEYGGYYATSQTFNNNLFTAHNAMNVLRVNCRGAQSFGPLFADVNGCYSINVECEAVNDFFTQTNPNINGVFVFNSTQDGPARTAKAILQKCGGYDVRTSSLAHSDGEVLASGVDWTKIVANALSYQGQTII